MSTTAEEQRRKPGRKPKGQRAQILVRTPTAQRPVFDEAAKQANLPLGDYVAVVLAIAHGLPIPDYIEESQVEQIKRAREQDLKHLQEELPISA